MKLILNFIKPYRWLLLFVLLVMVLDVSGGLLIPTITADIINNGVGGGNMEYIMQRGLLMIGISLLTSGGALLGSYLCAKLSAYLGRDLRNAIYDKSLCFSASDMEVIGTGSMITRTLSDVNIVQQSVVMAVQMVLPVPVVCIMGIVLAFRIDASMGWLIMGVTALILILAFFVILKAGPLFDRLQSFLDRMNVVIRENLTGVRVIRAFNKESYEARRMQSVFGSYRVISIHVCRLFAGLESTALLVVNLVIVAVLYIGGNRTGAGAMEIGDITALSQYAVMILFYLLMAQFVLLYLPRALVCIRRVQEVLSFEVEIQDAENAGQGVKHAGRDAGNAGENAENAGQNKENGRQDAENTEQDMRNAGKICGAETAEGSSGERAVLETAPAAVFAEQPVIAFEHVSFRFHDADEDTLHDLNFACRRGQTTAIIGSTGSGKSTVAKLILRFHDVTAGAIRLNGRDVRDLAQADLRSSVSYVPQKAWLFAGTVAENLRHGNEAADEAEMRRILSVAQSEFVLELPDGLATRVAQGGTNFSGGQKQRLSIARALIKPAELYIFDDSFSALDFKTDAALRKALVSQTKNAAVLIIAQRISTILNADQIIVLEDGKIAGIGTHRELMQSCPVYQDIAKSQMKGGGFDETE